MSPSIDDLVKKAEAGTFTAETLGTCIYRCVGYDAFHSLASTCWKMDRDLGTEYHPRFMEYLKMVVLRETGRACGMASATKGAEEPAGPVMANKIMLQRVIDYEHDKNIVRQTLNITRLRFTAFLIIAPSAADNPS